MEDREMMVHKSPPNWVEERSKCDIDSKFDALCEIVQRDVEEMNKLSSEIRRRYKFSYKFEADGISPKLFVVRIPEDGGSTGRAQVIFEKIAQNQAIRTHFHNRERRALLFFPRWVQKNRKCLFYCDDKYFEVWEISQKVLEPLFFED